MEHVCSDYGLMPILIIVKNTLALIQIIVPILLIIMTTIKLIKLVKNPEEKDGIKKIINSFIAAVVVFQLLGNSTTLSDCWNNASFKSSNTYYEIDNNNNKTKFITDPSQYEKGEANSVGSCLKKGKTTKVLFIGNSKTYVKDIPKKFANIAGNAGYSVSVNSVTEGGKTLLELSNKYSSSITSSSYDCVILQEQTDAYAEGGSTYSNGISAATKLVRNKNSKVKVYVRALWILNNSSSTALNKSYKATEKYAANNKAGVIYDGKAFEKSRQQYPNINLFNDDRHQSEAGAYLSALVIYKSLSSQSPTSITYYANLDKDTAVKLQSIAAK